MSDNDTKGCPRADQVIGQDHDIVGEPLLRETLDVPAKTRPSRFGLAVMASLVLHGAIAWAGINYASDDVLGGAEIEIETISVEIVGAIPKAAVSNTTTDNETASTSAAKPKPEAKLDPDRKLEREPPSPNKTTSDEPAIEKPEKQTAKVVPEDLPRELPRKKDPMDHVAEPKDVARLPVPSEKKVEPPDPAVIVEDYPVGLPRTDAKPLEAPAKPVGTEPQRPVAEANPQRIVKQQKTKKPETTEKIEKPRREDVRKTEKTVQQTSRASSSASNNATAVQQRVTSASKGALRIFARKIARALARSRPRRLAATGTVVIAFTLSESGTLGSVRVRKSSGNSRVDRAAVRAVRRAKFPRPPKGATRKQRSFVVPYHFRRR